MNVKLWRTAGLSALLVVSPAAYAQGEHESELEEIVVTALPLGRTVEQLAQPVEVLTGDELRRKQSTSIGETLSQELGLSSSYFGPISSRPVIRGQAGERVRVLMDGLDSLDVSALSEDHQVSLDSILTERIEIIRGPATLLYGSGAAGGLVNLIDNRIVDGPVDGTVDGAVSVSADSATGANTVAGKVDYASGNFGFHADYFYRETDDIEIPGFAESSRLRALEEAEGEEEGEEEEEAFGEVENSDGQTDGGSIGFSWFDDNGFVGLSISTFNSEYGIPGGHGHGEEEGEEEEEEEEGPVRIDLEQVRYDLKGQFALDGFFDQVKFRAAYNDYEHQELEGDEIGTFFSNTGVDSRVELRHKPIGRWTGAFGFQYKYFDFDAVGDEAFVPASETQQTSVFLFEELSVTEAVTFQTSARLEYQSIEADGFTEDYSDTAAGASVGVIFDLTDQLSLSSNLAWTQRHPTPTELFAEGPHVAVQRFEVGAVSQGAGFLDLETSTNLDVTLRGQNERISWSITGFTNVVDDFIFLSPTGLSDPEEGFPIFNFLQSDVEFYGIETEGRLEVYDGDFGHIHIHAAADFVNAEEDDGPYLPQIPPTRYGLGVDYEGGRFTASVLANFYDDQEQVAANELPTDSYTLISADVGYRHPNGLYLFVRGTNLSDDDARQHTSTLKDLVPLPGRSIQAGLTFEF